MPGMTSSESMVLAKRFGAGPLACSCGQRRRGGADSEVRCSSVDRSPLTASTPSVMRIDTSSGSS